MRAVIALTAVISALQREIAALRNDIDAWIK